MVLCTACTKSWCLWSHCHSVTRTRILKAKESCCFAHKSCSWLLNPSKSCNYCHTSSRRRRIALRRKYLGRSCSTILERNFWMSSWQMCHTWCNSWALCMSDTRASISCRWASRRRRSLRGILPRKSSHSTSSSWSTGCWCSKRCNSSC